METGGAVRRPALDGLRGVAALVVVVHHCLLMDRSLRASYYGGATHHSVIEWFVVSSPLRLFWAGDAAVAVFFVLSGYVLARPFLNGTGGRWSRYYPRRLVRLYLPVWAALAFALVLVFVGIHVVPVTTPGLVNDAILAAPDDLLGQLWSLHWEVLFSLLLPVYLLAVRWLARFGLVGFVPLILANVVGWVSGHDPLMYLTVFGFGALLAALEARPERSSTPPWSLVALAVAVGAMTLRPYPVLVIGSTAAVSVALRPGPVSRALGTRVPRWLGKVSFSLYLVHLPIVLAVARFSGDLWITLVLATALSLALAAGFHRAIEAPSQRLASRLHRTPAKPPELARLQRGELVRSLNAGVRD